MKEKIIQYRKPLLAAGLLVLLLVLYFYRHKIFKKTLTPAAPMPTVNGSSVNTSNSSQETILKKGSKGEQVRQLQFLLNQEHRKHAPTFIPLLEEDGIFGEKTEQMLFRYTKQNSITLQQLKSKFNQA